MFRSILGLTAVVAVSANIVNPTWNVVVGYWHNWCGGGGYKGGNAPCVQLTDVDPMYNVIDVSFMKEFDTPAGRKITFVPDPSIMTEAEFISQVQQLNNQGRSVILALGGADSGVEFQDGEEQSFAEEIIRLTDLYGFDGIDLDLEQAAIAAGANTRVIPAALKIVKDHYRSLGQNFLITMAPEFPYLKPQGLYEPYIQGLDGYYDWINPQFYNQGGDGVWVEGGPGWIPQTTSDQRAFIYYMADSLSNGSRTYRKIPHDKLVMGFPTSDDAAATGFVKNPSDLFSAFDQMAAQNQPLRGLMTWSVNWDMGTDSSGTPYNNSWINSYGPYMETYNTGNTGNSVVTPPPATPAPTPPATPAPTPPPATPAPTPPPATPAPTPPPATPAPTPPPATPAPTPAPTPPATATPPSSVAVPDWDVETAYETGSFVRYNGQEWQAKWWTKGYAPGTDEAGGAWIAVSRGSNPCGPDWSKDVIYNAGDIAVQNNKQYEAQWYTVGEDPSASGEWGVWKVKGECSRATAAYANRSAVAYGAANMGRATADNMSRANVVRAAAMSLDSADHPRRRGTGFSARGRPPTAFAAASAAALAANRGMLRGN